MKRQMKINKTRRSFTRALIGITAATPMLSHSAWDLNGWGASELKTPAESDELWLSAQGRDQASYSVGWINPQDESSHQQQANFRGHGLCQNPAQPEHVVMFSRRPGTAGIRLNTRSGDIDGTFYSEKDRYMQGHGCYSADGKWLYCTESSISSGEGKITVRDAVTLEQVNEFNSYGIGPHEILLMPDGHTLVVANGGLLTHPDSGRKVLNLATMRSSLTYIDSRNGDLISEHVLAEAKASIRHIAVASDGTVAIGLQIQREAMSNNKLTPLAAIHKPGQSLIPLIAPAALMVKLNDYMGSVAIHNEARIAAFASPKGDLVMFWHLDDLSWQSYHAFHDVCGLTVSQDNKYFVLSNSVGKIRQINAHSLKIDKQKSLNFSGKSWDNHLLSISPKHIR
jgi:hypothetical protein